MIEISIMSATGGGHTSLTHEGVFDSEPAWSPNGSWIAYVRRDSGNANPEIYYMLANGSHQTRVTNNAAEDDTPSWGTPPQP